MSTYSRRRRKKPETQAPTVSPEPRPAGHHNRLLAGYLADEFLTNSTLLGQIWDPAQAEAAPPDSNKRLRAEPVVVKRKCYEEVTLLLKSEGTQLAGVFNPSQLVGWLQM